MGLAGVDTRGQPPSDDEPVASGVPAPTMPDVQTQIRARRAERARVASSLGEPVTKRRAPQPGRGQERPPQHRRPSRGRVFLSAARRRREFSAIGQVVVLAALTAVIVIVLRTFLVASFYIPSASMEPTLHGCTGCEPDLVMVDKLSYRFSSVSRGDVIVFNRPPGAPPDDKQLIKRVIGLPGEIISGHDGRVWIGARPLSEPYVSPICTDPSSGNFAPVAVAPGHYFMMGDNRCDSFDSRRFGAIERRAIVGRAFAVVWPLKHLRWL